MNPTIKHRVVAPVRGIGAEAHERSFFRVKRHVGEGKKAGNFREMKRRHRRVVSYERERPER